MTLNATLAAAFANIEKWEAEQAEKANAPAPDADDSSAPVAAPSEISSDDVDETPEELTDAEVEELFKETPTTDATDTDEDQSANTWTHVSDAATPLVRKAIQVKGLDEKAVLVELSRSMFGTSKQDAAQTKKYGAGNVTKHLFKGNADMDAVKSAYSEVYTYFNDNTLPWSKGMRLLNVDIYLDFMAGMRSRIDFANQKVDTLCNNWDANVQWDLNRLTNIEQAKGMTPGTLADPENYPSADEVTDRFGIKLEMRPVPADNAFPTNIRPEDRAGLQKQLDEAESVGAKHVISEMIAPMQRAVEKLRVPIGTDGAIFRDSLIDNIVEVADRMSRINLSDDPAVTDKIEELRSLATTYANNKDVLRSMPDVRARAATQIDDLVSQMAGLV
jgi:hypothetical protein